MLKGSAKIQLFDAKTGKLTDEVEEHNLVTNAVNNVMSDIVRDWVNCYNESYGKFPLGKVCENGKMVTHNDFIQNFYGGVLVFSSKITENADHTFPTIDEAVTQIGHAGLGSAYTTDTAAGSFNASESSFDIENRKYQFVWDFSTSACNGDIASICLTSAACGQAGYFKEGAYNEYNYGVNVDTDKPYPNAPYTKRYNPGTHGMDDEYYTGNPINTIGIGSTINSYNNIDVDISSSIEGYTQLTPRCHKGYYYAIYYKADDDYNVYNFRCFDYDRKTYHDFTVNASDFMTAMKALDGAPGYPWRNNNIFDSNGFQYYIDDEAMVIYVGCPHADDSFPKILLGKLKVSDASYVTNTLTLPEDWSGDKGWASGRKVRFNNTLDGITVCCVSENDDYKAMGGTSIPVLLTDGLDIRKQYCMYNFHPYSADVENWNKAPSRKNMRGYKMYASEYQLYDMYYLATINNQSSILTKTRDKTMKVIYTITEV